MKKYSRQHLMYMLEKSQPDNEIRQLVRNLDSYKKFSRSHGKHFIPFSDGLIAASLPIDIFWAVIFASSLGFFMMTGLVLVVGMFSIFLGAGLSWKNYRKHSKEQAQLNQDYEIALCNEIICQELLNRHQSKLEKKSYELLNKMICLAQIKGVDLKCNQVFKSYGVDLAKLLEESSESYRLEKFASNKALQASLIQTIVGKEMSIKEKSYAMPAINPAQPIKINNKTKLIKSTMGGFSILSILFGSFYACGHYIFAGLGFMSAAAIVSNPITIGVMLGLATLYAVYYGHKVFINCKEKSLKKHIIRSQEQKVECLQSQLLEFEKDIKSIKKLDSTLEAAEAMLSAVSYGFFTQGLKTSSHWPQDLPIERVAWNGLSS